MKKISLVPILLSLAALTSCNSFPYSFFDYTDNADYQSFSEDYPENPDFPQYHQAPSNNCPPLIDMGYKQHRKPVPRDELSDNAYELMFPNDTYETARDREINGVIRNRLSEWLVDGDKNIMIRTSHGVTTIRGNVSSMDEQKKINDEAFSVVGVKIVFDKTIIIKPKQ